MATGISPGKTKHLDVGVNLITPLQGPRTSDEETVILMDAEEWCAEERSSLSHIEFSSESAEDVNESIEIINRELQSLCIAALHHDLDHVWSFLVRVLHLLEPIKLYVQSLPECQHYLERIIEHSRSTNPNLDGLEVIGALELIFPDQMRAIGENNSKPKHTYMTPTPPVRSLTPQPQRVGRHTSRLVHRSILLPDGTNPFQLDRPGEEDKFSAVDKSLTFGDLRKSIAAVGREAAQRESVWNNSAGFLMNAFETELPEDPKLLPRVRVSPLSTVDEETRAKAIFDEAMRSSSKAAGTVMPDGPMTAREAVAYFARLYHLGKIKHMYLNIVDQVRWSPYDLIAVPRQKINPEHYVFSTFGVLCVSKHQPCEVLSLGEWFRQAVIHKAISNIPFFKMYLLRRYFNGWVGVRRRAEYEKRHKEIRLTILRAVSNYNDACLAVARLLQELSTVSFLPTDLTVCYTVGAWRNAVNYRNLQSEKLLEKFYMHCRSLVEHARKEQFAKLTFWEKQVGNKAILKQFTSTKESLHLSSKKQKLREDNLKQCKAETNRLGNFVKLVDQLILAQLVHIIKSSVSNFVSQVLNVSEQSRDAPYQCALQFSSQGQLCTSPSSADFTEAILHAIQELPHLLCDVSYGIDAEYLVNDRVECMRPETRYTTLGTASRSKATTSIVSQQKSAHSQKHVRLTVAELKSHTARSENFETLTTPQESKAKLPGKEDNVLLVRTPDLAVSIENGLELVGKGYDGRYAPLTSTNVSQLLDLDPEHQAVIGEAVSTLNAAFDEIEAFVQENSWFNEIAEFCNTWDVTAKLSWKGAQAYHIEDYNPREQASIIEQQLGTIRTWIDRIKNFDKSFLSTNQVLLVDCSHVHNVLVPRLNDIYKEIIEFVADQSFGLAEDFIDSMQRIVQNMKNKKSEMEVFARYARQVSAYKKDTAAYQQKVEYIKSLFEVVRMSYRQLTVDEEKLESQVMSQWETFLNQIQDASEFINTQTPIMLESLEQDHEALMSEAERLGEEATSGRFLDPTENPTDMLIEMRHLRDQFYAVRRKLEQASKWREAIAGEGYQLDLLQEISDAMQIRQELWKYVEVSSHAISDWKAHLFKKLNTQKALDKVTEWLAIATQMKSYLPTGDRVLAHWFARLEDFKKDLPLLHKMASDALKPAHWHAIFVGMGEVYEEDWQLTVNDLLGYNLAAHQTLIDAIFSRARAEYRLEQKLYKIERLWTSNDVYFKLAKHIPDSVYIAANLPNKSRTELRKLGPGEKRASSRQTPVAPAPRGLDTSSDDLYILIDTEELVYLLEDSQVSLQQMLASPYIAGFRSATENLHYKLREIKELLELWINCQSKWLYLMKLFEDAKLYSTLSSLAFLFEGVHTQMKDIQKSILADPGVISITTHSRGEKGYKTLQGENLRNIFTQMIRTEEEILKEMNSHIEDIRQSFPRLYFVTNDDIISLMSIVRSPQHFIPVARKCFPPIETIRFQLPVDFQNSANIALDYQLNGDKLEAVHVFGEHDECLTLLERVSALHHAPTWLSQLDSQLKLSLGSQLQNCLLEHLHNDNVDLMDVLKEVEKFELTVKERSNANLTPHAVSLPVHLTKEASLWSHRLLKFPMQCLVAAEFILWSHRMSQALGSTAKNVTQSITAIRTGLQQKLEQVALVIRESSYLLFTREEHSRMRLSLVLRGLVHSYTQLITTTNRLLEAKISCNNCYDWSSTLKYNMDIKPLLRAKTFVQVTEEKLETSYHRERSLRVSSGNTGAKSGRSSITPMGRRQTTFMSGEEFLEKQKTSVEMVSTYSFGELRVQQLDASYQYNHEYQGPHCSYISTGLSERAHYSLIMAMKDFRLGTLIGPSSTGKTETVLSLAKIMGNCLFPITCSSEFDQPNLQRILSGVVQSGCWAVFDNSDRLTVELMSVAAHQLQMISHSLRTLKYSLAYGYTSRGVPLTEQPTKLNRRNSLTTLHSLPVDEDVVAPPKTPRLLSRMNTFLPEREDTTTTFAPSERSRRHSIDRETLFQETGLYPGAASVNLFYDNVPKQATPVEVQKLADQRHLTSQPIAYEPRHLGDIMYCGRLIPARESSACFMLFNSTSTRYQEVPQTLRVLMRPCAMIEPDKAVITETYLHSWGYDNSKSLTKRLMLFAKLSTVQISSFRLSLTTLLQILHLAVERFYNPALSPEFNDDVDDSDEGGFTLPKPDKQEESVVFGLSAILLPSFQSQQDVDKLRDIMRDVFPLCSQISPFHHHSELVKAIKDQLRTDGMQQSKELLDKILELHSALQQSSSVIVCGPAGSGKTALYQTLCRAINRIHTKRSEANGVQPPEEIQPSKPLASLRQDLPKTEYLYHSEELCLDSLSTPAEVRSEQKVKATSAERHAPNTAPSKLIAGTSSLRHFMPPSSKNASGVFKSKMADAHDLHLSAIAVQANNDFLKSFEAREKSNLIKKWGNVSRSFVRLGSLHKLITDQVADVVYPRVHLASICPNAMSTQELFGECVDGIWRHGTLTNLLRGVNKHVRSAETVSQLFSEKKAKNGIDQPSVIDNWVVLDGDVSSHWVDSLSSMMDSNKRLTLANGEVVDATSFTSLIFETGTLKHASPSCVARCALIHCPPSLNHWKSLISNWMLQARHKWVFTASREVSIDCWLALLKVLNSMITETFEPTLKFLESELETALDVHLTEGQGSYKNSVRGMHEVQAFLRIITALLNKYLLRDSSSSDASLTAGMSFGEGGLTDSQNSANGEVRSQSASTRSMMDEEYALHENLVKCIFVYSYIWGFGAHLSDSSKFKFDQYVKEVLHRCSHSVTLPRMGSVYDLFVDVKEKTLTKWQDKPPERLRSIPANYAVTSDIERIYYVTDLLISAHNHVLLTGAAGVGKTALVTNMLMTRQHYTKIAMCPVLTSAHFQHTIIQRLQDLRQKTVFSLGPQGSGVKPSQKHMFFIDDMSTAAPVSASNSSQPCLEALREMMSHKITYDRQRHVVEDAKSAIFLMACSTPGYAGSGFGTNAHSPCDRLIRQMAVINFFSLTDDGMHSLYGKTLQTWLEEFPSYAIEHHYELAKAMLQGVLDLYKLVKDKFRATPAHGHYVFTLHDIGHIVEGMLLLSPRKTKVKPRRARAKKDNAVTASNVQALFGGMLPGGKVSKDKFRSLSVKDSKDTRNQSSDAALPMMPVLVRLWCHEVSRTFADRLLEEEDDVWFKRTLRDLVEKHFCTASPDWIDSHVASKHMRAVMEDKQLHEKNNKAMKGTPLPFGHALGGGTESDDSDLSDGSMTEVTTDVVTPFSDRDMDPSNFDQTHGRQRSAEDGKMVVGDDNHSEEEMYQGAITPFTETTINLADGAMSPEEDDEKPTFDLYHPQSHFHDGYEKNMANQPPSPASSDDSDKSETASPLMAENMAMSAPQAADESNMPAISMSDDMTNFTSLTPVTWETRSVFTMESRRTAGSRADSYLTSETMSAPDLRKTRQQLANNGLPRQNVAAQQSAVGGVIKKRRSLQRRADSKRGVTFKMGLIADKEVEEEYKGALMTFDEIRSVSSEDLNDIIFSKHYISSYADFVGINCERGYAQYTEAQIGEALQACLHIYNESTKKNLRLVFFSEAIRHATRISRILSFSGAHALLLGLPHSAGRTTLIRLASHISHCKLFEVNVLETEEKTLRDFKSKVTDCSHTAGVNGKTCLLYVHSGVPESILADVCCLMSDGRYPGLYSDSDMQNMATAMTPGQVQTKKLDKIELSFERYLKKVRQNVHIVTSLDISASKSMHTFRLLQKYPQLITKAMHVDCYKPWSFETYQFVAKKWLLAPQGSNKVRWDRKFYMDQLICISKSMAYVHKTSEEALVQLHCHNTRLPTHKVYTPLTFREFFLLFTQTAAMIHKKAEARVKVLKQVDEKVSDAFTAIRTQEMDANNLQPELDTTSKLVKDLRARVEQWRELYVKALQDSRDCEDKLEELKKPLAQLRGEAEAEFDKVNVTYYAAMAAINSLSQKDLEELKSYRKPPQIIHVVGEALCIMFDQPASDWETAQQLMFSKNFFQDMEFYDKSHLSPKIYKTLHKLCNSELFQPAEIKKGSMAASAICEWMHSVYKYAEIYKRIAPKLARLMEAEADVTKTQEELGQKRLHATKTKKELEGLIAEHKVASQRAKATEAQFQAMKRRITEAKEVMDNMNLQINIWKCELADTEIQIDCAPGDAMLVAAICCYQGPLDAHTRERLVNDWRDRCVRNDFTSHLRGGSTLNKISTTGHMADLPSANDKMRTALRSALTVELSPRPVKSSKQPVVISERFSLESVLSDFTEMSSWMRKGVGHDAHNLHNALMLDTCSKHRHYWPVLVDPESHAPALISLSSGYHLAKSHTEDESMESSEELSLPANVVLPPVSAGTQRKGADVTPFASEVDSQSIASHSVLSHTTRNHSLSARRSPSSGALSPVQKSKAFSMTGTSDLDMQLRADREIRRPADNLWIVQASDPLLVKFIINAIVHGVVILVTHIERKSLPDLLINVIFKNFHKEAANGGRTTVEVKDFTYVVHGSFRLYMSMSSTLGVRGDDTRNLPYGRCNLIDLSVSQQAHIDSLLADVMSVEKADYEAQARSIEGGILHHKQELNSELDFIQNKILTGDQAILDDTSMLSTLKRSYQNIQRNTQILEETLYLSNQLKQKRDSYTPVAVYAAMMYEVARYMTLLSPYYSLPFEKFKDICRATIHSRHRGKGVSGDIKARCQELINAMTEEIFRLMKTSLFEDDWIMFALLICIQRMSSSDQFSPEELHIFINDVKHLNLRTAVNSKEKPHWIDFESWLSCHKLQETLPAYQGLPQRLVERSHEWNEYFTSTMSVVSKLPGDCLPLTLLQKCILWRVVRPDRFSEVCDNLLLTELGPTVMNCQPLSAHQRLYGEVQSQPVVLIEPPTRSSSGDGEPVYSSCNPSDLVRSLLPKDISHRVTRLSFGAGVGMLDVETTLDYCMKKGLWLVLVNCHLAPPWSENVLQLFKRILSIKQVEYQKSENKSKRVPVVPYEVLNPGVNPNFRLWFSTQPSQEGRLLPGMIMWHSTKYVLEQRRSYRRLLSDTYQHCLQNACVPKDSTAPVKLMVSELLLPLSIFHSQLLQRRRFSTAAYESAPLWSVIDLDTALAGMKTVFSKCGGAQRYTDFVLSVYKPSCTTAEDADTIDAMGHNLLRTRAELDQHEVEVNGRGSQALLATLADPQTSPEDVIKKIHSLTGSPWSMVSLAYSADLAIKMMRSRKMMRTLSEMSGHPEVMSGFCHLQEVFEKVDILLRGWESVLHDLPQLTFTPEDQLDPLQLFFHHQVETHQAIIQALLRDSELLHGITRAEFSCSKQSLDMIYQLYMGKVPDRWRQLANGSPCTLMQWKSDTEKAFQLLQKYTDKDSRSLTYNLSVFTQPQLFLNAILVKHARSQYLDVNDLELHSEFLPFGFKPASPPSTGVYVTGLRVHNALWDTSACTITALEVNDVSPANDLPLLHIAPRLKAAAQENTTPMFSCAVLRSENNVLDPTNNIINVCLPVASMRTARCLREHKVCISTSL